MNKIITNLTKNLKIYFKENSFDKAVIGLSGGIDSACVLAIAVKALGSKNVYALILPELGITSEKNIQDAIYLANMLKVERNEIPINPKVKIFDYLPWDINESTEMNLRARIRMCILYHYANSQNAIVLGTGNKTELMLGYGTKYGDFGVDIEVIGNLFKTEVFKLAKELKLPKTFIEKQPTAELMKDQTDEKEIGANYEVIDRILKNYIDNKEQTDDQKIVKRILDMVKKNRHKTNLIPVIDY